MVLRLVAPRVRLVDLAFFIPAVVAELQQPVRERSKNLQFAQRKKLPNLQNASFQRVGGRNDVQPKVPVVLQQLLAIALSAAPCGGINDTGYPLPTRLNCGCMD